MFRLVIIEACAVFLLSGAGTFACRRLAGVEAQGFCGFLRTWEHERTNKFAEKLKDGLEQELL